jgi:hypothetical protein
MFKCKKCSWAPPTNWNSSSDSIGRQLKNVFLFPIKCPNCDAKFPSKVNTILMGVLYFIVFVSLFKICSLDSNTNKRSSYNACGGVADQISRYIKNPQPNSNINALRNYYNEAQDLARSFDSDPTTNTNYCASILNAAAKAFLP